MPDKTITQRNARYRRRLAQQQGLRRIEVFVPEDRVDELRAFARSLRDRPRSNPELVNDRAKLLYHRLVARRLRREPLLIARARDVISKRPFSDINLHIVEDWRRLLSGSTPQLVDVLIGRSPEAKRLRLSSPFPFVNELKIEEEELRRRLWRVAKRAFGHATT
jgi:transcriptional regulator of acetoin/glycerol metabolism